MENIDLIFSEEQYNKLQEEYNKTLTMPNFIHIAKLKEIVKKIQLFSFDMPSSLRKEVCLNLENSIQILSILNKDNKQVELKISNPFSIIFELSSIVKELNSNHIDCPYKKICEKASKPLVEVICLIAKYFANKTIKTFKYI